MTGLLLVAALLSPSIACPPDVGHIRWDGVQAALRSTGVAVEGTVWDRDRDGKPSAGDVMRIEEARRGPSGMPIDETWVVLKGALAQEIAAGLRAHGSRGSACETPFAVKDVPTFSDGRRLVRHLRGGDDPAGEAPSKADAARTQMAGWASTLCASKRSISREDLARRLEAHAARELRDIPQKRRQRMANEVAAEYAMACTKLALPGDLTY